mgnify:CR=1 FL=1|jgi:outer membrane protein OmpA-like peptidoglycan-associated protein
MEVLPNQAFGGGMPVLKFAALLLSLAAIPALAAEPDFDAIAKKIDVDSAALHQNPKQPAGADCEKRMSDGTCPDEVKTNRQLAIGGTSKYSSKTVGSAVAKATPSILNLTFLLGSAQLSASAQAQLDKFAAALLKLKSMSPFSIDGHTDRSGSAAYNMNLSRERAQSVVDYLSAHGVARSRMTARGFGYDQPRAGYTPDSPANRRVEIVAR